VLRQDSVIFASDSILTGGSKNLRAVHREGDVKLLVLKRRRVRFANLETAENRVDDSLRADCVGETAEC
jgi:hypothetical protein